MGSSAVAQVEEVREKLELAREDTQTRKAAPTIEEVAWLNLESHNLVVQVWW